MVLTLKSKCEIVNYKLDREDNSPFYSFTLVSSHSIKTINISIIDIIILLITYQLSLNIISNVIKLLIINIDNKKILIILFYT